MKKISMLQTGFVNQASWCAVAIAFYGLASTPGFAAGFVNLPENGFPKSAYTLCNATGDLGHDYSELPEPGKNDTCAIFLPSNNVLRLPADEKFIFKKLQIRIINLPTELAGIDTNAGTVTDIVWRNRENTQCIYGALIHVNDIQLANGQSWEVNDLARGGFAGKEVSAAYYFAHHPKGVRSTESVFRIGRTHTSVPYSPGNIQLPDKDDAPSPETAVSANQKAAVSSNWVDFTTDLNAHDPDGSSWPDGSVMYIKTACNADEPEAFENAIRLRTSGQNGQQPLEIRIPGFAPAGANMQLY